MVARLRTQSVCCDERRFWSSHATLSTVSTAKNLGSLQVWSRRVVMKDELAWLSLKCIQSQNRTAARKRPSGHSGLKTGLCRGCRGLRLGCYWLKIFFYLHCGRLSHDLAQGAITFKLALVEKLIQSALVRVGLFLRCVMQQIEWQVASERRL